MNNLFRKAFDRKHLYVDSNQVASMSLEQIFTIKPQEIGDGTIKDAIAKVNKDFEKATTKSEMKENLQKSKALEGIMQLKKAQKMETALSGRTRETERALESAQPPVDQAQVDALMQQTADQAALEWTQDMNEKEDMAKLQGRLEALKRSGGKTYKRKNKRKSKQNHKKYKSTLKKSNKRKSRKLRKH
jgi:hypothetical protein